jgi:hypothetical protein
MLYLQLFFLPLFLVEFSTVSLLTLLPSMPVTAYAGYAVAGMFVVLAVWAAFGFASPAEPLPLALNVISKILCFVAAIMLFVWRPDAEVGSYVGTLSDLRLERGAQDDLPPPVIALRAPGTGAACTLATVSNRPAATSVGDPRGRGAPLAGQPEVLRPGTIRPVWCRDDLASHLASVLTGR